MIDMAAAVYRPSLAQVARAFVARELQGKAHALAGVANALPPTAELAELTGQILQIGEMQEPAELAQFATRVRADEAEADLADPVTRRRSPNFASGPASTSNPQADQAGCGRAGPA
ncbi:hypothetical protein VA596_28420 [Amycolatopsis sp., V23-08]|uniref:Uncharacterized protein n=1 Tax=Amycolatopsis heterodermiae TaxID=3110235 RepID=A0ABU5RE76_9PSEU|nr:hypothetical protein [Amycolatopsis sp., V23-08]MEA5363486.1 hypothetical protein [Amycolatopsis sp., V23-08]